MLIVYNGSTWYPVIFLHDIVKMIYDKCLSHSLRWIVKESKKGLISEFSVYFIIDPRIFCTFYGILVLTNLHILTVRLIGNTLSLLGNPLS